MLDNYTSIVKNNWMKDHLEGILQLKYCRGKYYMLDIGGQPCIKMCMIIVDLVMHVKEQED